MNAPAPGDARRPVAFISHHSSQAATARHLKALLERNGIAGWMAPDDIDPGVTFDQAIIAQVAQSDLIILLFCAHSDQSRHVKRELMLAEDSGKPIYPVRLEDVAPAGLAYWLKDYQWIDWLDRRDGSVDRLIQAIKRQAGAPEPERLVPPPPPPPQPPPQPPRGRLPLVAGAAALALAALLAWWLWPRPAGGGMIEAGRWSAQREVREIVSPAVAPDAAATLRHTFEAALDPSLCVDPATARQGGVRLFDPRGEGHCALTGFAMAGGALSGRLSCPVPGGAATDVWLAQFSGTYTPTTIDLDNDVSLSQGGSLIRMRTHDSYRHVGRGCAARP